MPAVHYNIVISAGRYVELSMLNTFTVIVLCVCKLLSEGAEKVGCKISNKKSGFLPVTMRENKQWNKQSICPLATSSSISLCQADQLWLCNRTKFSSAHAVQSPTGVLELTL